MSAEDGGGRPHLRRTATVALALALPVALVVLAGVNFLQASETSALADRQAGTVTVLERRVSRLAQGADAKRDASAIFLAGDGAEIARAELQKLLVDAVAAANGRLIESQEPGQQLAADAPDDGRIELRVTFDAKNDGLLDLVYGLETRLPLLTIERLETRRLDASGDENAEDPTLRVGLVVRGHRKPPS